jgi:hypothetical protein
MTERLGHKQTAAMFTLMVIGREVSNPELKKIVGFPLDGKNRVSLNERKLVDSRQEGRFFVHELTDAGWAWCTDEIAAKASPPHSRSTLIDGLYILLGGLHDYLRRENLRLHDVFAQVVDLTSAEIEKRIRVAYRKLAQSPGDWVALVDLRPLLGSVPAKDVNTVLKELNRIRTVNLVPESNRKVLTAADHEAAIRVGGEDNHLISIESS